MAHHWTESTDEIATLLARADAVEIAACFERDDHIDQVDDATKADRFSVYLRISLTWTGDPAGPEGAICIADRATLDEARAFASQVACAGLVRQPLPIHDRFVPAEPA